jgi:nucleoside phosphorylase
MTANDQIDIGVITIRHDEYKAVLDRVGGHAFRSYKHWSYPVATVQNKNGGYFRLAITRCHGQGPGYAHSAANDLIDGCHPRWIALVGICGAAPSEEFTLGDVVVATRLHDFSVRAYLPSSIQEYTNLGGEMAPEIQNVAAHLYALKQPLGKWQDDEALRVHPPVDLDTEQNYKGDADWTSKVKRGLSRFFGASGKWPGPQVTARSIASSGDLIKDASLLDTWLKAARDLSGVEMELPGVYRAAASTLSRRTIPIFVVRGISDIVGFSRDPDWTTYACDSAAAFFIAFLKGVPHELFKPADDRLQSASRPSAELSPPVQERPTIQLNYRPARQTVLTTSEYEESARSFAETFNAANRRIVGPVIETHGHPNLESDLPLSEVGWSPSQVLLKLRSGLLDTAPMFGDPLVKEAFETREGQRKMEGEESALKPPDGTKYTVVDASSPFLDIDSFTVTLQETRYFSILRCRPAIEVSPETRKKYAHVEPGKNRVPQAMGLQFLALFDDDEVLTIQRAKDTYPFPGTWSFSGEEQFAPIDLEWPEPERMKQYLLRAAVEEIFPLARVSKPEMLLSVMRLVQPYFTSMRVWSLFFEVPTVTFSFFSVFRLNVTARDYAYEVRRMVQHGLGQSSREGQYFSVALSDVKRILDGHAIRPKPLFGGSSESLSHLELHPTSRYRLRRFVEVIGRK